MGMEFRRQGRAKLLMVAAMLVLVTVTIYVSAASRQPQRGYTTEAIDLKDPAQVRQALLFDPFEPQRATETAATPDQSDPQAAAVVQADAGEPVADEALALADSSDTPSGEMPQIAKADTSSESSAKKESKEKKQRRALAFARARNLSSSGADWRTIAWIGGGLGVAAAIAIPIIIANSGGDGDDARSPAMPP